MKTQETDVLVIGAGIAGLSAAYRLHQKDKSLIINVVEAKDRVGGRTVAAELNGANGPEKWDLGGQWVSSVQPHIMSLMEELNMSTQRQYTKGKKVMQVSGRIGTYTGDIPPLPVLSLIDLHLFMQKVKSWSQQISADHPEQFPMACELDKITCAEMLDKTLWTTAAKEVVASAWRCIHGVEPEHMSALYALVYASAAGGLESLISAQEKLGGQEFKVDKGAWNICNELCEKLGEDKVHLAQPVKSITQLSNCVRVETLNGFIYESQRVIMAIPPHEAAKISYDPPLPIDKLHVMQRFPVGYLTKIIVTYKQAFWREKGFSGDIVTSGGKSVIDGCSTGPLCVAADATSPNGSPAMCAFIGGDQQLEYANIPVESRKRAVIHSFSELLGPEALDYLDYAEQNWNEVPYNGGCPVSVATPGVMTQIAPGLRLPFDRVHFAGTESATVWCGFLNGAVQSGYRAAHEVLYYIRPDSISALDLQGTALDKTGQKENLQKTPGRNWIFHGSLILAVVLGATFYYRKSKL